MHFRKDVIVVELDLKVNSRVEVIVNEKSYKALIWNNLLIINFYMVLNF